jgi:hypothetical protein
MSFPKLYDDWKKPSYAKSRTSGTKLKGPSEKKSKLEAGLIKYESAV